VSLAPSTERMDAAGTSTSGSRPRVVDVDQHNRIIDRMRPGRLVPGAINQQSGCLATSVLARATEQLSCCGPPLLIVLRGGGHRTG